MKRHHSTLVAALWVLVLSAPALAQSKGGSRDQGASKSQQNRDTGPQKKTREPASGKSDQSRDSGGRSGAKSRR